MDLECVVKEVYGAMENNGYKYQEVMVEYSSGGDYKNDVIVQFTEKQFDALRELSVGDTINIAFNLSSRLYNGKSYTTVRGWKIDRQFKKPKMTVNQVNNIKATDLSLDEDLPF